GIRRRRLWTRRILDHSVLLRFFAVVQSHRMASYHPGSALDAHDVDDSRRRAGGSSLVLLEARPTRTRADAGLDRACEFGGRRKRVAALAAALPAGIERRTRAAARGAAIDGAAPCDLCRDRRRRPVFVPLRHA